MKKMVISRLLVALLRQSLFVMTLKVIEPVLSGHEAFSLLTQGLMVEKSHLQFFCFKKMKVDRLPVAKPP
jgi:hypothetical protein